MFKFGFSEDGEMETKGEEKTLVEHEISWKECREVKPEEILDLEQFINECDHKTIEVDNMSVKYISSIDVILKIIHDTDDGETPTILKAEEKHSDLLTGIYEGGLKIWECTYDSANYILKEALDLEGKKILDLGCGAGIIGILCTMKEASCYFQDYNEEVLKYLTIPNLTINNAAAKKCRYFSGDWLSFSRKLEEECMEEESKFDLIFSCETIYNPENYNKLHHVFKSLLKKNGIIYLAAKSYYFGVGGSLSSFKDFIENEKIFQSRTVWTCSNGLEREIIEVKFNK